MGRGHPKLLRCIDPILTRHISRLFEQTHTKPFESFTFNVSPSRLRPFYLYFYHTYPEIHLLSSQSPCLSFLLSGRANFLTWPHITFPSSLCGTDRADKLVGRAAKGRQLKVSTRFELMWLHVCLHGKVASETLECRDRFLLHQI